MSKETQIPWASGPGEILRHGLDLLKRDNDTNRRLAMISIDNSVELMIKTFLGLPKRVNGLTITRKEYQEISESFPKLLDALEAHATDKLDGIDLGVIEWYHRLRNELYHQGNGLTVERDKVVIYAELANLLFKNLFGQELVNRATPQTELLGEFMEAWVSLESGLRDLANRNSLLGTTPKGMLSVIKFLEDAALINRHEMKELREIQKIRNEIVHGVTDYKDIVTPPLVNRVKNLGKLFSEQ